MTGFAMCGSFCSFARSIRVLEELAAGGEQIIPVMSYNAATVDTRFGKAEDFVKKIMPYALKAVEGIGFNPLVLVAQAALETGWGRHVSDNNNYFGIKANDSYKGEKTSELTFEYINGKKVNVIDRFRKYSGVLESMKDYISFIKDNPRYKDAIDKSYSPDEYFEQIHKAGYATDPDYADKLKKISRKIAFMAYK